MSPICAPATASEALGGHLVDSSSSSSPATCTPSSLSARDDVPRFEVPRVELRGASRSRTLRRIALIHHARMPRPPPPPLGAFKFTSKQRPRDHGDGFAATRSEQGGGCGSHPPPNNQPCRPAVLLAGAKPRLRPSTWPSTRRTRRRMAWGRPSMMRTMRGVVRARLSFSSSSSSAP